MPASTPAPQPAAKRVRVYLVASPIGDYLSDLSVAAVRALGAVRQVFIEEDDEYIGRLRARGILTAQHHCHLLEDGQQAREVKRARELVGAGQPFAILASSGLPCFWDPGWQIVDACLSHHLAQVELVPVGLSSALDAALCLAGTDMERFCFNGHYPEHYCLDAASLGPAETPLVYFVRGEALPAFVTELSSAVPHPRRVVLLRDIRKKGRARVRVLRALSGPAAEAVPADAGADYVCVVDRRRAG